MPFLNCQETGRCFYIIYRHGVENKYSAHRLSLLSYFGIALALNSWLLNLGV